MKVRRVKLIKPDAGEDPKKTRARNKLIRLYNQMRNNGGWRAVARARKSSNQQYIYNFAIHGIVPPNAHERVACFLPVGDCPVCGKPLIKKARRQPAERKPIPEWLKLWRKTKKQKRDALIEGLMTNKLTVVKVSK